MVFAAFVSILAFAALPPEEKLLECNLPLGPDQEVRVVRRENKLYLRELTLRGRWQERRLPEAEWKSQRLALRQTGFAVVSTLAYRGGEWRVETATAGKKQTGKADCDLATAKK